MNLDALKEELALFAEKRAELLQRCPGQFALIKGRELIGTYPTQEAAYEEGFRRFLQAPFLVKRIVAQEESEQVPLLAARLTRADL